MTKTHHEVNLLPYPDGSGYRATVRMIWQRDDTKDIVKHIEIDQGGHRIVLSVDDWIYLRDATDGVIQAVTGQNMGV